MQFSDLVHHAVQLEVVELMRCLFLEHIQQHDVNHGLHQNIRSVGTYICQFLHPSAVIIVLHNAKLKFESIRKRQFLFLVQCQFFHQRLQ